MIEQWQFNRALQASKLKGTTRAVLMHMGVLADWPGGVIPERFSPSLNKLADITGFSRRAVMEHLNIAEQEGWVVRTRPETAKALGENERTGYRLVVPDAALVPRKGGQELPYLGQELPQGRAGGALGVRFGRAAPALPLGQELPSTISSSISTSSSSSATDPVAQIMTAAGVEEEEAKETLKNMTAGKDIRSPARYVRQVIQEGDLDQYLPRANRKPAYTGPRCDFSPDRDPTTCSRCGLLETHASHREVA